MPSLGAFRGIHDRQVGINRRFERRDILKVFDPLKYVVITEKCWPFILSPVIWLARYIQRMKMKLNSNSVIASDVRNEGRLINSILFALTNSENNLLSRKPFGSSLFLAMRKKR
jgi:hypothetical protein